MVDFFFFFFFGGGGGGCLNFFFFFFFLFFVTAALICWHLIPSLVSLFPAGSVFRFLNPVLSGDHQDEGSTANNFGGEILCFRSPQLPGC